MGGRKGTIKGRNERRKKGLTKQGRKRSRDEGKT